MQKVVCLMPTYGRFSVAERAVSFFQAQTYPNKEMVIFNQNPVPMHCDLPNVKVVNVEHSQFYGLGSIYTEALKHCDGDLINMWDDDNGQFPWLLEDTIRLKTKKGAKSETSWVLLQDGRMELGSNLLEPSVVLDMDVIRRVGFNPGKAFVHTKWFYHLYEGGELQLIPQSDMLPGLVYVWAQDGCFPVSCNSNEEIAFENFRKHSHDFGTGEIKPVDVRPWWDRVTKGHGELRKRLGLQ